MLGVLKQALEESGHARLAAGEPSSPSGGWWNGLIVPVVFWSLGSSLGVLLDSSIVVWFVLSLGVAVAYSILAAILPNQSKLAGALLACWICIPPLILLGLGDPKQLIWTYGAPLAIAGLLAFALSRLRLRQARDLIRALAAVPRAAPYVAPVVLVAILLPALTADVWQLAADTATANLLGAAVLSVGVLMIFVRRQLGSELAPVLAARCRRLATRATAPERTRAALSASLDDEATRIVKELPDETFAEAWRDSSEEYVPYLVASEGRALRQPLTTRLFLTVAVIALLLASYIYALLAVTVPESVGAQWADTTIPQYDICLLIATISVPGGPYFWMATLLGIFATAIFLAFALTEERVASALTEALLRDPIERFLLVAVPFVTLIDRGLTNIDDFYLPEPPEPSAASGNGESSK